MRQSDEVYEKFNEVFSRRLKERKEKYLCRSYMNCCYNERNRVKGNGQVGFCQNEDILKKTRKPIVVCNDDDKAKECPCYDCLHTEESVHADFMEILRSPSRCGKDYPKLAVLIWVLYNEEGKTRGQRLRNLVRKCVFSFLSIVFAKWW